MSGLGAVGFVRLVVGERVERDGLGVVALVEIRLVEITGMHLVGGHVAGFGGAVPVEWGIAWSAPVWVSRSFVRAQSWYRGMGGEPGPGSTQPAVVHLLPLS